MQDDDLREYVRTRLRHSLFESVWELLHHGGYVDDVKCGANDRDWLVARAREMLYSRKPVREPVEAAKDGPTPGQERAWALSQLVVHHAQTDPDVVRFRTNHLAEGLVKWDDVEKWIRARAEQDGQRTIVLALTLPVGTTVDLGKDGIKRINPPLAEIRGECHFKVRMLEYALPGDEAVRRISVTAGGVLGRLRRLTDDLADFYSWRSAQATVFVLTGITPFIPTVRMSVPAIKIRNRLKWARRIQLDIDPGARPQEVLDAFERAREDCGSLSRRALSVKHLRLAAFAGAEHVDKSWTERHRLWNEQFPEWSFPAQSNFRRDAALAQRRILYPGDDLTSG
jgi:hypothetical protein